MRRYITGLDTNGRSTFIIEDEAPNLYVSDGLGGVRMTMMWRSDVSPASNVGATDAADVPWKLEPKHGSGGNTFQLVEIPPGADRKNPDASQTFKDIIGDHAVLKSDVHPQMHKTRTVDYIAILEGEIYAIMETGERLLKAGDFIVQRGTVHHWANRSDKTCKFAAVVIDAAE